jgi:deoxyribonuclease-4
MPKPTAAPSDRKPNQPRFGAHMSIAGGCEHAVTAAHAVGFETVQLFTKSNAQWKAPELRPEHTAAFRQALASTGIGTPVAHTSYLINLASPDSVLWERSIDALTVEIERCAALGIRDLVMHPGSHLGEGEAAGIARIVEAIDEVAKRTAGLDVRIDLETTAGQGTNLGHRFEHLRSILETAARPERLGICVDTCHIFAAGYPLETKAQYKQTTHELLACVTLEKIRVWHFNDSKRELGSRVDRHAAIGGGHMGLEPFRHIVNDRRFRHIPMILETPKGEEDGEELDARNLRVLRELLKPPKTNGITGH